MPSNISPFSAREQLLLTAERLIAQQGPALPLRQIVLEAGQRNKAAIRYHFGTREDLITAILDHRQEILERNRLDRLAQLDSAGQGDLRDLVSALLEPVFAMQRAEGDCHHARFIEKVRDLPDPLDLNRRDWPATAMIVNRIVGITSATTSPLRKHRTRSVMTVVFALLADLERTGFDDDHDRAAAEHEVINIVVGAFMSSADRSGDGRPPG